MQDQDRTDKGASLLQMRRGIDGGSVKKPKPFEKGCKLRSAELARIRALFPPWQGGWILMRDGFQWFGPDGPRNPWYPDNYPDSMKMGINHASN
jgi:hypothetical protein